MPQRYLRGIADVANIGRAVKNLAKILKTERRSKVQYYGGVLFFVTPLPTVVRSVVVVHGALAADEVAALAVVDRHHKVDKLGEVVVELRR